MLLCFKNSYKRGVYGKKEYYQRGKFVLDFKSNKYYFVSDAATTATYIEVKGINKVSSIWTLRAINVILFQMQ